MLWLLLLLGIFSLGIFRETLYMMHFQNNIQGNCCKCAIISFVSILVNVLVIAKVVKTAMTAGSLIDTMSLICAFALGHAVAGYFIIKKRRGFKFMPKDGPDNPHTTTNTKTQENDSEIIRHEEKGGHCGCSKLKS